MSLLQLCLVFLMSLCGSSHAFDWNDKTVLTIFDFRNMEVRGGHPLATHRAFKMVANEARRRALRGGTELSDALSLVYGEASLEDLEHHEGLAFQTTLFGNWLNEVNTNLDLEGGFLMGVAAKFLAVRYNGETAIDMSTRFGEVTQTGDLSLAEMQARHSTLWDPATGYSSTNFRHSMMITSKDPLRPITQDQVFEKITEHYAYHSISAAIQGLIDTVAAEEEHVETNDTATFWRLFPKLRKRVREAVSIKARNRHNGNFRYLDALSNLGGVLHLIQDSSVACTERVRRFIPNCVEGDGHGILREINGRMQVVSLADDSIYQHRKGFHGDLDRQYRDDTAEALYGAFDPAIAGAHILREVALAVYRQFKEWKHTPGRMRAIGPDGLPTEAFARMTMNHARVAAKKINNGYVRIRYAEPRHRIPFPRLQDLNGARR